MGKFQRGVSRSAREVSSNIATLLRLFILGVFLTAIAGVYASLHIPSPIDFSAFFSLIKEVIELVGIVSTALIIIKMPYWGTLYMFGWIAGFLYFWSVGLVSTGDVLIYTVPSVIVLVARFYEKFTKERYSHNPY